MVGYNEKTNRSKEPLILEREDWTEEEYKTICKVFRCSEETTRIKVSYDSIEWFEEPRQDNQAQELAEYLNHMLSSQGYADYVLVHLGEAVDVVRHDNCLMDLDNIIHLREVLGFNVSHELYSYIDSQYDDSLLEITDWKELMEHVWKYVGAEQAENIYSL